MPNCNKYSCRCNKPCCFLDTSPKRIDCNYLKFVSGNQLMYNRNVELYAKLINNFEHKCKNQPCARNNCYDKPKQLPYASSFEDVLKMRKAQEIYSNPNYGNGIIF